jgi:HEAT repeat protein
VKEALAVVLLCAPATVSSAADNLFWDKSRRELLDLTGHVSAPFRYDAAQALAAMGEEVLPDILPLLEKEGDWRRRRAATDVIAALATRRKLKSLAEELKTKKSPADRAPLEKALVGLGPAVPGLVKAARDRDAWVRQGAVVALTRLHHLIVFGRHKDDILAVLQERCSDAPPWMRERAIRGLKEVFAARKGDRALPKLSDRDLQRLLASAIAALAGKTYGNASIDKAVQVLRWREFRDDEAKIPVMLEALTNFGDGMFVQAVMIGMDHLIEVGVGTDRLMRPLLAQTRGNHPRTRVVAASFIGNLGPEAAPALDRLREMAADRNQRPDIRREAVAAIAKITGDARVVETFFAGKRTEKVVRAEVWTALLNAKSRELKMLAIRKVGEAGKDVLVKRDQIWTVKASTLLQEIVKNGKSPSLVRAAREALRKIGK